MDSQSFPVMIDLMNMSQKKIIEEDLCLSDLCKEISLNQIEQFSPLKNPSCKNAEQVLDLQYLQEIHKLSNNQKIIELKEAQSSQKKAFSQTQTENCTIVGQKTTTQIKRKRVDFVYYDVQQDSQGRKETKMIDLLEHEIPQELPKTQSANNSVSSKDKKKFESMKVNSCDQEITSEENYSKENYPPKQIDVVSSLSLIFDVPRAFVQQLLETHNQDSILVREILVEKTLC